MRYLQDKVVLITGAGFSAPADLPIQDKILREMTEPPEEDFIASSTDKESVKFLTAYIRVAIYLLREYADVDVRRYIEHFNRIDSGYRANERVLEVIEYIRENFNESAEEKNFNLIEVLNSTAEQYYLEDGDYYFQLMSLKETLRVQLLAANVQICLEDVFTLFDKCITMKENTTDYTYAEIDRLQHALLRLFTFYFSNKVNRHEYNKSDYLEVIKYIRAHSGNVSVVTTNWDILLEKYLENNGISYDYRFNSPYVMNSDGSLYSTGQADPGTKLPYIKIHGSINWFRCLKCGTLQIYEADKCGGYLFDDDEKEKCIHCGQVSEGETVQIKPEIITPTMMKLINSQLYNNLWKNTAYALQKADKVVFCGYSLPMADYEFRYLLKQNIRPGTKIDVVLYHNDDPKRSTDQNMINYLPEKRYMDLFSNCSCNFYYEGFGDYFNHENQNS